MMRRRYAGKVSAVVGAIVTLGEGIDAAPLLDITLDSEKGDNTSYSMLSIRKQKNAQM